MARSVTIAVTQFACSWDIEANLDKAELLVRQAAAQGANIVVVQELFATPYFCQDQDPAHFDLAQPFDGSSLLARFSALAAELGVVLPISFFERAGNAHFNSVALYDADGCCLGRYRKSHIPDGPGYQEKFYFSPGDSGIRVFDTRFCKLAVLVCWDQWFPEAARCAALQGAELIVYPSAIGSEPADPSYNSYPHWCRTMLGHAAANLVPVAACNRIGSQQGGAGVLTFYGGSFISDHLGAVVAQVGSRQQQDSADMAGAFDPRPQAVEGFVLASFDLDQVKRQRLGWGLFRDRRPELYGAISSLDGSNKHAAADRGRRC